MKASVASHLSGDLFVAIPGVSCIATFKDLLQVCKKTEFVLSNLIKRVEKGTNMFDVFVFPINCITSIRAGEKVLWTNPAT